jgi:hypothetical protein
VIGIAVNLEQTLEELYMETVEIKWVEVQDKPILDREVEDLLCDCWETLEALDIGNYRARYYQETMTRRKVA